MLAREGFDVAGSDAHIVTLVVGDAELAQRIVDAAVEQGVYAEAIHPPAVPDGAARLRLAVMASHTRAELRDAARGAGARGAALRVPAGRAAGAAWRLREPACTLVPVAYSTSDLSISHSTGARSSV